MCFGLSNSYQRQWSCLIILWLCAMRISWLFQWWCTGLLGWGEVREVLPHVPVLPRLAFFSGAFLKSLRTWVLQIRCIFFYYVHDIHKCIHDIIIAPAAGTWSWRSVSTVCFWCGGCGCGSRAILNAVVKRVSLWPAEGVLVVHGDGYDDGYWMGLLVFGAELMEWVGNVLGHYCKFYFSAKLIEPMLARHIVLLIAVVRMAYLGMLIRPIRCPWSLMHLHCKHCWYIFLSFRNHSLIHPLIPSSDAFKSSILPAILCCLGSSVVPETVDEDNEFNWTLCLHIRWPELLWWIKWSKWHKNKHISFPWLHVPNAQGKLL